MNPLSRRVRLRTGIRAGDQPVAPTLIFLLLYLKIYT